MHLELNQIFKRPEKRSPIISKNGTKLAFIESVDRAEYVVLMDLKNHRTIGKFELGDTYVMEMEWMYDDKTIYLIKDNNGDENFRLFTLNIDSMILVEQTPFPYVYVKEPVLNKQHPNIIFFSMNKDTPQAHDAYMLDIRNKELKKLFENDGNIIQYIYDGTEVRAFAQQNDDVIEVMYLHDEEWGKLYEWDLDSFFFNRLLKLNKSTNELYLLDAHDNEMTSLSSINVVDGKLKTLYVDEKYDIDHVVFSPGSSNIEAIGVIRYKNEYVSIDNKEKYADINRVVDGEYSVISQSMDGKSILRVIDLSGRVSYMLYCDGRLEKLFSELNELEDHYISEIEPLRFESRDGLEIEGYITYPQGRRENLPLVINVHGGPWGRDTPYYIAKETMWLTSRGFATMNINFRGSTGYGTKFFSAGRYQWGRKMQDDLIDGVNWAIERGITTEDNVSIFGMSYGGYAVLAAATLTPDVFCCGVDRVGPSDVVRILKDMPPQWGVFRKAFYYNVGDPDEHKEMLYEVSPLHHVDKITMPLLVAQGKNDPRVKVSESEDIVNAMKKKGLDCEYILFEDEGHVFVKEKNLFEFYERAEKFLDLHHKK